MGVWAYIGLYYQQNRHGWLYVLSVLACIVLGLWSSYQCNFQLGLMFSMFEAHNLMGFYHCVIMLSLSSIGLVGCLFCVQVLMGLMRIAMIEFYTTHFPTKNKHTKQCAHIISTNIPQMTLQWMVVQDLFELVLKAIMYGYIIYTLVPDDPRSFFGYALTIHKPIFWMIGIYTTLLFVCVAIALHFYNAANTSNKAKQSQFNQAVALDENDESYKKKFISSFMDILKTYSVYSALLMLGHISSTILPWVMVGYAFFQGMIPLSALMQVCHALHAFMHTCMRFLEKSRRLSDFNTHATLCVEAYNQSSGSLEKKDTQERSKMRIPGRPTSLDSVVGQSAKA